MEINYTPGITEKISLDEFIARLNALLEVDREAMSRLFLSAGTFCNAEMANHPTVQVHAVRSENGDKYNVRMLGILNGIFGAHLSGKYEGWGEIAAITDEAGITVLRFARVSKENL
jgi:hypothetical protein